MLSVVTTKRKTHKQKTGHRELSEVMDIFVTLVVVIVP